MIFPVFRRRPRFDNITALYGAIVAQARTPAIYRAFDVPDTLEARFEMLVLHLGLVLDLLESDPGTRELGQQVFDLFCQDMDDHMREMGVGDLTVPKKMRRVADAFYGRHAAYRDAIGNAGALSAALARNVYGDAGAARARDLADYVGAAAEALARQDAAALAAGRLIWPDAAIAHAEVSKER